MIIDNKGSEIETFGDIQNFKIGIDPKNIDFITTLLSSNLYSHPEKSFIREIVSNAWDSHVEAGNTDEPVLIIVEKGNITIRDYGTGLSPERFKEVYCNIGSSTKRESNDYIGAFGIGHYAPLACSNTVYVTSFYNGTEYQYIMTKVGNSITTSLVLQRNTEEKNGLQVTVKNVVNIRNQYAFNRAFLNIVFFPNVYLKSELYSSIINDVKIKHYKYFSAINREIENKILLGYVLYPLNDDFIEDLVLKRFISTLYFSGFALKFNIGELEITPNREQILYTEKNKVIIEERIRQAREELYEMMSKKIKRDFTDFIEFLDAFNSDGYDFLTDGLIKGYTKTCYSTDSIVKDDIITYKGEKVNPSIIKLHKVLLHFEFMDVRGVQVKESISKSFKSNITKTLYVYDKIALLPSSCKLSVNKRKFLNTYYANYVFLNSFSKTEVVKAVDKLLLSDKEREFVTDNLYESISSKIKVIDFENDKRYLDIVASNMPAPKSNIHNNIITITDYSFNRKYKFDNYEKVEKYLKSYEKGIIILPSRTDASYKNQINDLCILRGYKFLTASKKYADTLYSMNISCLVSIEDFLKDKIYIKVNSIYNAFKYNDIDINKLKYLKYRDFLTGEDSSFFKEVYSLVIKYFNINTILLNKFPIDTEYVEKVKKLMTTLTHIQDTLEEFFIEHSNSMFLKHVGTAILMYTKTYRVSYNDYKGMKEDKLIQLLCKNIIKIENKIIVTFPNGNTYECKNLSKSDIIDLIDARTEEEVIQIIHPEYKKELEEYNSKCDTINNITKSSKILYSEKECIYWKEVSNLSLPMDFAEKVAKAEKDKDELLLETYMNFWTLMSLNTDELCRQNLFKFLTKYGLKLARCGFFIAYRNADFLTEEDGIQIYTDKYTHKMRIKIGEVVTLDRTLCDSNSSVECSRGLHCSGASWLERNYFGDTGLVCLVNPADVVAVPFKNENYGKLRTCAYLPIAKAKFGEDNHIIPFEVEDGFDCGYVSQVIYEGLMGTEEDSPYRIKFPDYIEGNKTFITDRLLEIAKNCIVNKQL